jgi:mannosyltransferase OCH1-like enzyme
MKIPKILHQTWKNEDLPAAFAGYAASWKEHHPDWQYMFWTDEMNRAFIKQHYGWFLDTYDGYEFNIQRADAIRYFLLTHFGGVYVDLDNECFKSIEGLVRAEECFFALEPDTHARSHQVERIISNALMGAIPNHPFFAAIMKDLLFYKSTRNKRNETILYTTGPMMIERVLKQVTHQQRIGLLPSNYCEPLSYLESEQYLNGNTSDEISTKLQQAYCVHYHWGTWWRS